MNRYGYPEGSFTADAWAVFERMGVHGLALLIPFDDADGPALIGIMRGGVRPVPAPVARPVADELRRSPFLHRLSEFGEGSRLGWRELSLPGERGALYVHRQ